MSNQGVKYTQKCIVCGNAFHPYIRKSQITCGRECRAVKERIQKHSYRVYKRHEELKKKNERGDINEG